jgi:CheY-like chemotaxis protein
MRQGETPRAESEPAQRRGVMRLSKISLGKKIGMLFLAFLTLTTVTLVAFLMLYRDFRDQRARVNMADRQGVLSQQIAYFSFLVSLGHDDARAPLREMVTEFDGTLAALEHGGSIGEYEVAKASPSVSRIFHEVKAEWKDYWGSVLIVTELPRENPLVNSALEYIRMHSDRMLLLSQELSVVFAQDPRHDWVRIRSAVLVLFLAQILLFTLLLVAIDSNIFRRLTELRKMTLRLAEGDMSARARVSENLRSRDEIGDLARSLNLMAENFQAAIARLQRSELAMPESSEAERSDLDNCIGLTGGTTAGATSEAKQETRPHPSRKIGAQALHGEETILLAEDNEVVRGVACEILELHGYKVLPAVDGRDAIKIAGQHAGPIELMITDVMMPGMNGRELASSLSASRPDMKVLYMSAYPNNAIAHLGVHDPGVAFLQKPFTPDGLAGKVREVLDAGKTQELGLLR